MDHDLARSLLPPCIQETPDLYASVPGALDWVSRISHDLHPMELGLRGAQSASLAFLRPAHQAAIVTVQTGLSPRHFTRAFGQFIGVTPSQYRTRHLENA